MKKLFNKYLSTALVLFAVLTASLGFSLVAGSSQVSAASASGLKDAACQGVGTTGCTDSGDPSDPNSAAGKVNHTIKTVINILSFIVGVAAVLMLIIGGFRYITSGGDSGKVSSAKDTILYSIIGLVVVILSQAIVKFVLAKSISF